MKRLQAILTAFLRHYRGGEHGAAMVEFALTAVLLLTVLFGVIGFAWAFYAYNAVAESAREGSRFAIVRGSACAAPGYECDATAAQIQTYVKGIGFPGINPADMTVTTTWAPYPAGGNCSPSAACNNPGNVVQVKVVYDLSLAFIPFVPSNTIAMSSTSAMVISQ